MKKVVYFLSWFILTSVLYTSSIVFLLRFSSIRSVKPPVSSVIPVSNGFYQVYSSIPENMENSKVEIEKKSAEEDIIKIYLEKYKSPFKDHSRDILEISHKYKTEQVPDLWRYIVSIAQCESNLGHKIPEGSFNAWGLGVFTGAKSGMAFNNWPEGIEAEAKFLRKLIDKGLLTPEQWGPIYAPPSASNGGSWAKCVREFLPDLL